jgi:multiple sugar transport system ATP-binding protein
MEKTQIELEHIYKKYDRKQEAVYDFNLEVYENEFLVMVGPSGCGKSTILRMIAGLEEITAGNLFIDGNLANDIPPKDRDIAMVFQNYALYPHMTVYDNMAFALKMRKIPTDQIESRVRKAARFLNIEDYLQRLPRMLSGGEKQRVALGRAMVREPQVFLMDEPLSNLDAQLRNQVRSEILKLHQRLNSTFIYVTHDQTEAMTMGSRIVVINDGHIQQIDTPQGIFEHPGNIFVASFIGSPSMNLFAAALKKDGTRYAIAFSGQLITLESELCTALQEQQVGEQPVIVGIRPEDIVIVSDEPNTVACQIELVEPIGSEMYIHLQAGKLNLTATVKSDYGVRPGQTRAVKLNAAKLHFFDPDSEQNLTMPAFNPKL